MAELQLWQRPDSYAGENPTDHYLLMSVHRDSDTLSRSNWRVALRMLGYDDLEEDSIYIMHCSHWAVGWVDHLLIHQGAPEEKLETAREILESLEQYPVLDDEDWSSLQLDEIDDYWQHASQWERADWYERAGLEVEEDQDLPDDLSDVPETVRDYIYDRWD